MAGPNDLQTKYYHVIFTNISFPKNLASDEYFYSTPCLHLYFA